MKPTKLGPPRKVVSITVDIIGTATTTIIAEGEGTIGVVERHD